MLPNCSQPSDVCCQTVQNHLMYGQTVQSFTCSQTAPRHLTSCHLSKVYCRTVTVITGLLPNCPLLFGGCCQTVHCHLMYCQIVHHHLMYGQSVPRLLMYCQIVHHHLMYGQTVPGHLMYCHLSPDVLHIVKLSSNVLHTAKLSTVIRCTAYCQTINCYLMYCQTVHCHLTLCQAVRCHPIYYQTVQVIWKVQPTIHCHLIHCQNAEYPYHTGSASATVGKITLYASDICQVFTTLLEIYTHSNCSGGVRRWGRGDTEPLPSVLFWSFSMPCKATLFVCCWLHTTSSQHKSVNIHCNQ